MSQWYLSKNGKAQGPLDEAKIIKLIEAGDVNHLDLVFKVGSSEWIPIVEVEVFTSAFKKEEPVVKTPQTDAEWILLKKTKDEKGSQYTQLGPFSKEQVLDLVERGEIKFKDFAWRQGLDSWVPLADLEQFSDPLPSTPQVDKELYESDTDEQTQTDGESFSLTGLVEIEHFEHEKTQVMSSSEIPLNSTGFATETDFNTPTNFTPSEDLQTPVEDEVTQTGEESTDADLWTLKPPDTVSQVELRKKPKKEKKKASTQQKKKNSKGKKATVKGRPVIDLAESPWPWVAAAGVLFLSVIFLYISFSGDSDELAKKEEATQQENSVAIDNVEAQDFEDLSFEDAPVEDVAIEELSPSNDPQLDMGGVSRREVSSSKTKKRKAKKRPVKKKLAKKIRKKSKKKMARSKVVPKTVRGSKKAKSFYKQRDRKALFYSSLKVESLIIEIERNFKKLRKKKKSWKKFYSGWKKRAKSTMPKLVQKFPERGDKYAYPKLLTNFKEDHHLVLKYGEVYNARVLGLRRPAGVPKNVKSIFTKYKKQAQKLGR